MMFFFFSGVNPRCKRFQEGGDEGRPNKAIKLSHSKRKQNTSNESQIYSYNCDGRPGNSSNLEVTMLSSDFSKMHEMLNFQTNFNHLNSSASPPARAL